MTTRKHFEIAIDTETSSRAGAHGMFQVEWIEDEEGNDCTDLIDQGTHYPDLDALAEDLSVPVTNLSVVGNDPSM
jgi:hypothetical protein